MFLTGQLQFEPSFPPFLGFGFRGAMERDDLGDGAQTQPLAASESGSGVLVVDQSLAACLVQDEQPSAAASVGESYVVVDATGFDDWMTVTSQTSHQAVGSVAGAQPLAGGDPQIALVALRSCTQELEVMKDLKEWSVLWDAAQKHVLNPRRALAQHFTSACQPQKQQGPAGSLKQCGLEDPIPASGGNVSVKMTIPNAFDWGDGLEIAYVSPAFPNLASAQKHACLELLCFLLVTAPTKVIMHPHEYLNQLTSIEQLRAQGQEVRVVYLQLVSPAFGGSTSGISMAERITDMLPRERPPSKRSTFHVPKFQQVATPPPGLGGDELDAYVINLLQDRLVHGQWYQDDGLPVWVWPLLKECLPKNGLLPFLQRHPTVFVVNYTGKTNRQGKHRFEFRVASPGSPGAASGASHPPPPPPPPPGAASASSASQPPGLPPRPTPPPRTASNQMPPPPPPPPTREPSMPVSTASSTPSVFGKVTSKEAVAQWSVQDVMEYLNCLELGHMNSVIIAQAIDGRMLVELVESDIDMQELGFSRFQTMKIKQRMPYPPHP